MSEHVLQVEGLSKRYGAVEAVEGAGFTAGRGRITVFLGENGAGKTTTLKCILGFLRPDAGRIVIRARRLGYVPEHPVFFTWLTGRDILSLTGRVYGIREADLSGHVSAAAAKLGFDEGILTRRVQTYSHGNQKKFSYLQNLIFTPDLLIVDEPFSALDPVSIKRVRDIFLELKGQGRTAFLSSHLISEAEKIADDVVIIKKGRICFRAKLAAFRENHVLPDPSLEAIFLHFAR